MALDRMRRGARDAVVAAGDAPAHDTVLDASGIQKSLGSAKILDGISFAASRGDFVSIVGPSGCGKTTLLMCLAGLMLIDRGHVSFEGVGVTAPLPGIAVVFQDYSRSLLPWRRNVGNVMFGMKRTKGSSAEKEAIARELLAQVGLRGYEDHYPWQTSGGMQQRVAIARAIASQSRLLLLDEPLGAVDAQTRAEMQDLLLALAARYRQTCVLVTHDVDEAAYMANRIIVLSRRPTRVVAELDVPLTLPRDQITTRAHPDFLRLREQVLHLVRGEPTLKQS